MQPLTILTEFPENLVEALAQRVALKLSESRWLYGDKAAAEYLGWPVRRVRDLRQAGLRFSPSSAESLMMVNPLGD